MSNYRAGDLAHFHAEFRDPDTSALVNPTTVSFLYETPAGVETTLVYGVDAALTRPSTGKYLASVLLPQAGLWTFQWRTSGTYQGATEFSRVVDGSAF